MIIWVYKSLETTILKDGVCVIYKMYSMLRKIFINIGPKNNKHLE